MRTAIVWSSLLALMCTQLFAADATTLIVPLEPKLVHLRNEPVREWSTFPEQAERQRIAIRFQAGANEKEYALRIRQQDVKQTWRVLLNDKPLGELIRDEADTVWYLPVPPGGLKAGENTLLIEAKPSSKPLADDIRVGELRIGPHSVEEVLSEATIDIRVQDADTRSPIPARITIVTRDGARQATAAVSSNSLAVRPGVIYTADGHASFNVPAGEYVVYANRGFEYSLARVEVKVAEGETSQQVLSIRREVQTPSMVACDTHIHTLTHSGHGDASIDERMITLAGEGIELPIATDHNKHIDYREPAKRLGVSRYFTPVIGNEVTTTVGHFNIFPVDAGARLPNHQRKEWAAIFREIYDTPGVRVAILNHARDIHGGTRPFGAELFNPVIGENTADWPMKFNAMEVINSGAVQTDPLQLPRDWLAVLNRGYQVTPVGSSDSHDVSRYIVGQGRTYIRCNDKDVGQLDTREAIANFQQGRVVVSYGLYVDLVVDGETGPGDLTERKDDEVVAKLRVLGPHWTTATQVQLYCNGQLLREEAIAPPADRSQTPGVQWQGQWRFPRPKHDAHLVAIALGKGIDGSYWATAKPYQPMSPDFQPYTLSVTGPVRIDGDGDSQYTSPREYAEGLHRAAGGDLSKLVKSLAAYDAAIAAQAMHLHLANNKTVEAAAIERAVEGAAPPAAKGIRAAWQAWRNQELARAKR